MTKLVNDDVTPISPGNHTLTYTIGTGTAKLTYSVDGKEFIDVPNSDKTATTGITVRLPSCQVVAVLTGDAELSINRAD